MKRICIYVAVACVLSGCVSMLSKLDHSDYMLVTPAEYRVEGSDTVIKTTLCQIGVNPGFIYEMNTPAMGNVAGHRSVSVKEYPPPAGHRFYCVLLEVKNSRVEHVIDINKTSVTTGKGLVCYPYYAMVVKTGSSLTEEDLLAQDPENEAFALTIPSHRGQMFVRVYYAVPLDDVPIAYAYFGSNCGMTKYERK